MTEEILRNTSEGKGCAAVMLDLDYFKGINDTYGHDAGDRYLQVFLLLWIPCRKNIF